MEPNHPAAPAAHADAVIDTIHDLHPDHRDPQRQTVQQNLWVAVLPLALIALAVLVFVAAAWTILVAQ
jgi:hypothetical protein